jgi:hypothetical protein
MKRSDVAARAIAAVLGVAASVAAAQAADLKPLVKKAPIAPVSWWDTLSITGNVEVGITGNSVKPPDGINFGHLFTDKANTLLLNQATLTVQRPLDPKATGYDFGFKFKRCTGRMHAPRSSSVNSTTRLTLWISSTSSRPTRWPICLGSLRAASI